MILSKCKKICFAKEVIAGLLLQFFLGSVVAIPLQQGTPEEFSAQSESMTAESLFMQSEFNKTGDGFELNRDDELFSPDIINTQSTAEELQNLKSSIYFQDKKKRDKQQYYSPQNKEFNSQPVSNILEQSKTDLSLLLEPLASDPELKEKVKDTLESIKDVKELLTINTEVSFENSEQETQQLIEKNLYRQEQQKLLEQKNINNKVTKEKYDPAMFRAFFSKVWTFVLYGVLAIFFMKLMFMFISWQRKIHRY